MRGGSCSVAAVASSLLLPLLLRTLLLLLHCQPCCSSGDEVRQRRARRAAVPRCPQPLAASAAVWTLAVPPPLAPLGHALSKLQGWTCRGRRVTRSTWGGASEGRQAREAYSLLRYKGPMCFL